jgi:hypothetical protein
MVTRPRTVSRAFFAAPRAWAIVLIGPGDGDGDADGEADPPGDPGDPLGVGDGSAPSVTSPMSRGWRR